MAQLADDDTAAEEPRGVEPEALRLQAADAVARIAIAGLLRGNTVAEFHSPHGGTWTPLLLERGFTTGHLADVVIDSFGMMHEPDQRRAIAQRATTTTPDGVLLLQYHSLAAIVRHGQWNALRHGHYAYYSLRSLMALLNAEGMSVVTGWPFDLYGGTVLIAAVHGDSQPDDRVAAILAEESGMIDPDVVGGLQLAADHHRAVLRGWLERESAAGRRVYAYGAASRAAALFRLAGVDRNLVLAVADASRQKHGRRMPGTDVPIISPAELIAADPDRVLLTVPDLINEVRQRYPQLDGCWCIDDAQLDTTSEEELHR